MTTKPPVRFRDTLPTHCRFFSRLFIAAIGWCAWIQSLHAQSPALQTSLAERERLNQSIWRNEATAQAHERIFTQFWDRIRASDSKLDALATLKFSTLTLASQAHTQQRDLGIQQTSWSPPHRSLTANDFQTELQRIAKEGFVVESTEWHHQSFDPVTEKTPARSRVSFLLNLQRHSPPEHVTVTGILNVTWSPSKEENPPQIESIQIENADLQRRLMSSGFANVATIDAREIGEKPFRLHPLILHDLNHDGLSEVILAGANTVHWNLGNGKFERKPLLKKWRGEIGESAIVADFNGDQHVDFLCITARDRVPVLFLGNEHGEFLGEGQLIPGFPIQNASAMTAGDIDGDHDLDVYVTQYRRAYTGGQMPTPFYNANDGYPAYLMINNGAGQFADRTEEAGLAKKRFRRTYSTSFVDLDGDQDQDLMVVSDFAGVDLYANDGTGNFKDVRDDWLDQWHNFGMAHSIADFNRDGRLDFYVIGMSSTTMRRLNYMKLNRPGFEMHGQMRTVMGYGNRLYLNHGQSFQSPSFGDTAARTGWSWGTSAFDFDNDGDEDLYVANGFISGDSTQDYCTTFWCHDIYTGNSKPNPKIASILYSSQLPIMNRKISWNGYEHNQLLLNERENGFRNVSHLVGTALNQDCRAVASDDLNGDGRVDLLVVEELWEGNGKKTQKLHVLANALQLPHHWVGVRLRQTEKEQSTIGATVRLKTTNSSQMRTIVTGDSFYTQHAPVAHFGLGTERTIESLEVQWPSGKVTSIPTPRTNRYYQVP